MSSDEGLARLIMNIPSCEYYIPIKNNDVDLY